MTTKVARQQKFDKRKRSFQATWFHRCKWPHNDAGNDSASAFCFACCKAATGGKVRASFREMQKKIFYLINLVIVYVEMCRMHSKIS